jgi:hypothetical protein
MHYTYLLCCYLVDVCPGLCPASSNWILPLCGTLRSTRKCTIPRHILFGCFSTFHEQNKRGSSFCWQKRAGQWCRLASSRRNIVDDRAGGRPNGRRGRERHIPACCAQGQDESLYVTVSHKMTAGWICSESSDPVNGRKVSLSISRSDNWLNNCLSSSLLN